MLHNGNPFVKKTDEIIGEEEKLAEEAMAEERHKRFIKANPYFRKVKAIEQGKQAILNNDNDIDMDDLQDNSIQDNRKCDDDFSMDDSLNSNSVSDCDSDDSNDVIIIKPTSTSFGNKPEIQNK